MTKPRTSPKVIKDFPDLADYLNRRRLALDLSHADLKNLTGTHTGFNYVVSGRSQDLRVSTLLRLLTAFDLEIEIRPKEKISRAQRVMAARKAAAQSESPSVGAEE